MNAFEKGKRVGSNVVAATVLTIKRTKNWSKVKEFREKEGQRIQKEDLTATAKNHNARKDTANVLIWG